MPQLNPEFFVSQLFWLVVFFSFLFVFLWRVSLPRIATALEKRQNKIDENLSNAKKLQEEAKEIEVNINEKIKIAKKETDDQIKKIITSLENEVSSQLSTLDRDLEEKISKSEKEIISNRNSQMENINDQITDITKTIVSKITDISLSDSDINKAIKSGKEYFN
tara:strand:- start:37 stop:528 length:492 start_codon:yes stop_codon:yes gene_type:complete